MYFILSQNITFVKLSTIGSTLCQQLENQDIEKLLIKLHKK